MLSTITTTALFLRSQIPSDMPRFTQIANSAVAVPMPGYGAMGLSQVYGKADDEEAKKVLRHAIEIGCTFWNTATIYGPNQANEKLLGQVLREGDNRSKIFLTTKWGLRPDGTDGSTAFAEQCMEDSIRNLGSAPDAWLLHRIDKKTPVEESVAAMEAARQAGKCKYIGLSAISAATLRRAAKVAKIDFVEQEFSPFETSLERSGLLNACKELGVQIFAYSPLGSGFLTGRFRSPKDFDQEGDARATGMFPRLTEENWANNVKFLHAFEEVAKNKDCTPGQLALAWVSTVHGDTILPIPGTKSIKYLDENFAAGAINLSEEDLKAVRHIIDTYPITGPQLSEAFMSFIEQ